MLMFHIFFLMLINSLMPTFASDDDHTFPSVPPAQRTPEDPSEQTYEATSYQSDVESYDDEEETSFLPDTPQPRRKSNSKKDKKKGPTVFQKKFQTLYATHLGKNLTYLTRPEQNIFDKIFKAVDSATGKEKAQILGATDFPTLLKVLNLDIDGNHKH